MRANHQNGFTLLELMLVIAVLMIIVAIGQDYYTNYVRGVELDAAARLMANDLKTQREKSLSGLDDRQWGIKFVNGASDDYLLFSTPDVFASASTTVIATSSLPTGVSFVNPSEGASSTIIFTKIFATTTPASVTVGGFGGSKIITVSASGIVN